MFQGTEPTIEVTTTETAEVKKQANGTVTEPEEKKDGDSKVTEPNSYQHRPAVEKEFHGQKTGTTAATTLEGNTTNTYNQTEARMTSHSTIQSHLDLMKIKY